MPKIKVGKSSVALVDEIDADLVRGYRWHLHSKGYAVDSSVRGGRRVFTYMHRLILGAARGELCDHVNMDRLDNRRQNLRLCSRAENARNLGRHKDGASGYKGVTWHAQRGRWMAQITRPGVKGKYIGLFDTAEAAARAYDNAAKKYHGAFARLNFPE